MSKKLKDIVVKNRIYSFFIEIINIESFNPSNIKIDEHSSKNILFYSFTILDT